MKLFRHGPAGAEKPGLVDASGALRADYEFGLGGGTRGSFGAGIRHASSRLSLVESDPLREKCRPLKQKPHPVVLLQKVATPDLRVADHASLTPVAQHVLVRCKPDPISLVRLSQDAVRAEVLDARQATKMMISAAPRLKVAKQFASY